MHDLTNDVKEVVDIVFEQLLNCIFIWRWEKSNPISAAYALQHGWVCLLQIPTLLLFKLWRVPHCLRVAGAFVVRSSSNWRFLREYSLFLITVFELLQINRVLLHLCWIALTELLEADCPSHDRYLVQRRRRVLPNLIMARGNVLLDEGKRGEV